MKIHYAMMLFFVAVILTYVLVSADTTFFDNPDDAFIMGSSATGEFSRASGEKILGDCLTNWICAPWSSCIDGIQIRNCAKEKEYCYADLKEKPIESQNCSIKTEKQDEMPQPLQKKDKKIINFIFALIILAIIILFASKIFRRRRHKKYGY